MKKNKKTYEFTSLIREQITEYCYSILNSINKKYLKETNIFENEFLEYLYMGCKKAFEATGSFQLNEDDIVFLIFSKRQGDRIIKELEDGNVKLIGINKDDDLIFEFKNKETLENFNNLKK